MRVSDAKDITSQAVKHEGIEYGLDIRNTFRLMKKKIPKFVNNPTAFLSTIFLVRTNNYGIYIISRQ